MGTKVSKGIQAPPENQRNRSKLDSVLHGKTVRRLSIALRKPTKRYVTMAPISQTIRPCADGCENQGLMTSIDRGHRACVMKLLSFGEDPHEENENGDMPFHRAVRNPPILEMFLEFGCNVNIKTSRGQLVSRTADEERRPPGRTALHMATEIGNVESVKLLLEYGAEPDPQDLNHMTPIMIACQKNHRTCMRQLLKANLYYFNKNFKWIQDVFYKICEMGDIEMMKMLINAGGDPFHLDSVDGMNSLMVTARAGQVMAMRYLLQLNIDLRKRCKTRQWTAYDYAMAFQQDECARILQEREHGPVSTNNGGSFKRPLSENDTDIRKIDIRKGSMGLPEDFHISDIDIISGAADNIRYDNELYHNM